MKHNPFIISMGDPAGVGVAILSKILDNPSLYLSAVQCDQLQSMIVFGSLTCFQFYMKKDIFMVYNLLSDHTVNDIFDMLAKHEYNQPLLFNIDYGEMSMHKASCTGARFSYQCVQYAIALWNKLKDASLITLPVSKEWILKSGIEFNGHTSLLSSTDQPVMCMYHPQLSVILATQHIPLSHVPQEIRNLSYDNLQKAIKFFSSLFGIRKQIGVLGINPHAGEGGRIGNDELFLDDYITSWEIKQLDPHFLSPDSAFLPHNRNKYDVILAWYHDQGLIPFKTLFGMEGLNITLNLPKLRVSPDHGPAYAILDKYNADITSVQKSIQFAMNWSDKWINQFSSQAFAG